MVTAVRMSVGDLASVPYGTYIDPYAGQNHSKHRLEQSEQVNDSKYPIYHRPQIIGAGSRSAGGAAT